MFKISGPFNIQDIYSAPNLPGLYVWYGRFRVEDADWKSAFADGNESARSGLLQVIREHSYKFGRQEMKVRADSSFSSTWKGILREDLFTRWRSQYSPDDDGRGIASKISPAVKSDEMRELLISFLDIGFPIFSSPLYLGKASNQTLLVRLKQHSNHFLELWERYVKDRQFIERIENPKNFPERAIKLGFTPEDLFCFTVALNTNSITELKENEISLLIESAEWLLNRWATPILGRQ